MKITADAIELFYKMFFSCYVDGKPSSENNRKIIEENLAKKIDIDFARFCKKLQQWDERREAIVLVAKNLGKKDIDREVIVNYFGSSFHTDVVLGDLAKEQIPRGGKFYNYTIFNHMLMPIVIKKVSPKDNIMIGEYQNGTVAVKVNGILFWEKDRKEMIEGRTVLCHYPMVVDNAPGVVLIKNLLYSQANDSDFMEAARSLVGNVNHFDFPYLSILKKRM